jgi:hypothetical protein
MIWVSCKGEAIVATAFAEAAIRRRITTAEFTMTLDERGVIHVVPTGEWDARAVDLYFLALNELMAESRADFGCARVLVDRRSAPVQSPDVHDRLKLGFRRHYRPGDRVAVVVPTTLTKLQVKRWLDSDAGGSFLSIGAAEHFLLAR